MRTFAFSFSVLLSICSLTLGQTSTIFPTDLTVESMINPVGVQTQSPRLSWNVQPEGEQTDNLYQSAYQILVSSDFRTLVKEKGDIWDSGKVAGKTELFIPYGGKPLESSQDYFWKVRVWDQSGNVSAWSKPSKWVMGIVKSSDWKAKWIALPESTRQSVDLSKSFWIGAKEISESVLTKTFVIPENIDIQKAFGMVYIASNGKYTLKINGQPIISLPHGDTGEVSPTILRAFDISSQLKAGENTIEIDNSVKKVRFVHVEGKNEPVEADFKTAAVICRLEISQKPQFDTVLFCVDSDSSWTLNNNSAEQLFAQNEGTWGKLRCRKPDSLASLFYKSFEVENRDMLQAAVLHITGLGTYEAALNGTKIGNRNLEPAPTDYNKRVGYSTYDLTESIRDKNEIYVQLGHGWYDMRTVAVWDFDAAPWRDFPRMIAQLELRYKDGTVKTIISDDSWSYAASPIVYDSIRQGEIYDGRIKPDILGSAVVVSGPKGELVEPLFAPTVWNVFYQPVKVYQPKEGVYVYDFGKNIAGEVYLVIPQSQAGDIIKIRYGERITEAGELDRNSIECFFREGSSSRYVGEKGSFQTDWYICNGTKDEEFDPVMTYHGFQYVEISGLRAKPGKDQVLAYPMHGDFPRIGWFDSSNKLINSIQSATLLSYLGNSVNGMFTDCPHREKNGWAGDAHLAAEQAMYNFDNLPMYRKWLTDFRDQQLENGNVPAIIPSGGWGFLWGNGPAWDSAMVIIPWYGYIYRGDKQILEDNYQSMKKYVDYVSSRAKDNLVSFGLSDWCAPKKVIDPIVTSSAYYYLDAMIVSKTAEVLGKPEDAKKYAQLAQSIRTSFNKTIYKGEGVYGDGSQCAQATAIHQGLAAGLPQPEQKLVVDKLIESIKAADYHLDTGILGCKYIFRALSENGRTDVALRLLLQDSQPCYADWIRRGGGTLWEDFDQGASRNHIMFGDVSAWFYQYLAGIQLDGGAEFAIAQKTAVPAFQQFTIAPQCRRSDIAPDWLDKPIRHVSAIVDGAYGKIASAWNWNEELTVLTMQISVPANSSAKIIVPAESGQTIQFTKGQFTKISDTVFQVNSGDYEIIVK